MGYYAGDYYGRGDYYRGDPGFLQSLGSALAGAGRTALGFATGGILGAATSAIGAFGSAASKRYPAIPGGGMVSFGAGGPSLDQSQGPLIVPGGRTISHPLRGGREVQGVMRGFHVNRSTYATRGGGTSKWPTHLQLHHKGTVEVRNRRMNPGNGRALVRSIRRLHAFARIARHAIRWTSPRPPKGRMSFKRRRHVR